MRLYRRSTTQPKCSTELQLGDSVHVNVLFTRRTEAGREKTPTLTTPPPNAQSTPPPPPHPQTSSANQIFRPQSLKKPLGMRDSLNVTVRELRVTSVTVTSAGRTAGLHATSPTTSSASWWSSPGFSDAATSSVLPAELHSSLLSCAETEERWPLVAFALHHRTHKRVHVFGTG